MDLIITTQVHENYGAHNWNGEGDCPQRWKAKGGEDYIITGVPAELSVGAILPLAVDYFKCESDSNYFRENVLSHYLEESGFLTPFEKDQMSYEGKIRFPAKRISYTELLALA